MQLKTKADQIEMVQQSFHEILVDGESFIKQFYIAMFEMYPETKAYFASSEMPVLRKKILQSLTMIIDNLNRPNHLKEQLGDLGQMHADDHNIRLQDYAKMRQALIKVMEKSLPETWNPVVEAAWVSAFADVTFLMTSDT